MASRIVILIQSNPEESHRPCEGIRMALGLAACHHWVDLILCGKAPLLLTDNPDDYVDHEMAQTYLSTIRSFIPTLYIEKGSQEEITLSQSAPKTAGIDWNEISKKIAAAECFIRF